MKWLIGIIVLLIVIGGGWYLWSTANNGAQAPTTTATSTTPAQTYGMAQYTDPTYGFSFWYPNSLTMTASTTNTTKSFPGGTEVELLQVGSPGGTYVAVVTSPASTITDEPSGHASPIAQTKYFYDQAKGVWMVAYPEGTATGKSATTTADISKTTIAGLPMLPSGARFDTTIIPLSTTEFLVIGDGGGSSFTSELARTVAAAGATIDPTVQAAALQAEEVAYGAQQ
ncbi:MAG TPA: hypothetical protein VG102_01195 [Candidatus Paceibacterota bacterium]|jgi:hypothetical protein|nr:hypothetical protein [Candidatus Paceibacterota bacterium]